MKFSLNSNTARYTINGYGPGQVVVNQEILTRSVVVMPDQLLRDWPPQTFADLTSDHFAQLAQYAVAVVLLGTGDQLRFPRRELIRPLEERRIGVEVMDTGAACRTYGVLVSEGRSVAAALLMPDYLPRK